uniref:Uncharacterized protein n=1 Tax=Arundo donax TaxID=35708 RepID=A0A0A8ZRZ0_ARUDO
MALSFLGLSVH